MMENDSDKPQNNKKCYSCGKTFRTPANLLVHKKRKTPCLIREVSPEDKDNPNRCIFCNKILANKSSLVRHHKTCKIKNGGMDILDEKIQYEQELRILKEKNSLLEKEVREIREQIAEIRAGATGTVNNFNAPVTFVFNNYESPQADTLQLTQDDLLVENIAKRMIEIIYFNQDLPANHTIYLPNIRENRLLVYRGGQWETVTSDGIPRALTSVRNAVYTIGSEKINGIYNSDEEFMQLYPVVRDAIVSFNSGGVHAKCSDDEIMGILRSKRDMVRTTLSAARVIN